MLAGVAHGSGQGDVELPIYRYLIEDWPKRNPAELVEARVEDLGGCCLEEHVVDACIVCILEVDVYSVTTLAEIQVLRHRQPERARR